MKTKIIIITTFVCLILLSSVGYFIYSRQDRPTISPNILGLTPPVMSFSGTVEKIQGNKLTLTQTTSSVTPPLPSVESTSAPFTYVITVADSTQISAPPSFTNYLFKPNTIPPPTTLTLQDIQLGQNITVASSEDLRTLRGKTFTATFINLPQKMTTLRGSITAINNNTLIVKTQEEKEYTISMTPDTEVSHTILNGTPKPELLTLADLKKDMQVAVYTDTDVTQGTQFTALRIDPNF